MTGRRHAQSSKVSRPVSPYVWTNTVWPHHAACRRQLCLARSETPDNPESAPRALEVVAKTRNSRVLHQTEDKRVLELVMGCAHRSRLSSNSGSRDLELDCNLLRLHRVRTRIRGQQRVHHQVND